MILDKFRLEGKVALVTGGSKGIGRSIALAFAEAGADVAICARTAADVERATGEIRQKGRRAVGVAGDVRVEEQVDEMVRRIREELGTIDILMNNAGGMFWCQALNLSLKGWNAILHENLTSVFLVSRAVARAMIEQGKGGSIINMSSRGGRTGGPGTAPYAAAKAGVVNLTASLAAEWARYGIRVNCIAPAAIWTEGAAAVLWNTPERQKRALDQIIIGRFGTMEDVALACIYLASDASSWITAQTFDISGGIVWW